MFIRWAIGKSAQFGLHTDYRMLWKVLHQFCFITCGYYGTAGIFLLIDVLFYSKTLLLFIIYFNYWAITTIFAGSVAVFNMILKKLLHIHMQSIRLYVFYLWLSQYQLSFYHLLIMLFLKLYIFKCWFIIHLLQDEQDIVKWVVYTFFTNYYHFFYYR